jgi:hyperosmotically inducible protein
MKHQLIRNLSLAAAFTFVGTAAVPTGRPSTDAEIAAKTAHEVRMYTRYTIWDNVNIGVRDGIVELSGQVSEPFKKHDLERLSLRVPGVTGVANRLEVLPLSRFDDELRIRVARALYRDPVLSRYGLQSVPPIHVIVNNGRVTLEGVVNNEMEKNVAGIRANSAGLSFGAVTNNLRVENPKPKG